MKNLSNYFIASAKDADFNFEYPNFGDKFANDNQLIVDDTKFSEINNIILNNSTFDYENVSKLLSLLNDVSDHPFVAYLNYKGKTIRTLIEYFESNAELVIKFINDVVKKFKEERLSNSAYNSIFENPMSLVPLMDKRASKSDGYIQENRLKDFLDAEGLVESRSIDDFMVNENTYIADRYLREDDLKLSKFMSYMSPSVFEFYERYSGKKEDFYIKAENKKIVIEQKLIAEGGGSQDKQINELVSLISVDKDENLIVIGQLDGAYWERWNKIIAMNDKDYNSKSKKSKAMKQYDKIVKTTIESGNCCVVNEKQIFKLLKEEIFNDNK